MPTSRSVAPSVRGRPRAFDTRRALDDLAACFWGGGYAATTYADLERATGLHRQSLVYAFGDKRAMFLAALEHYAQRRVDGVLAELGRQGPPLAAVRAAVDGWLADASRAGTPGCLLVSTSGEFGSRDPDVVAVSRRATGRLVQAFTTALAAAQVAGDLPARFRPADLAHLVVAAGDGALLHARGEQESGFAAAALRGLLAALDA